MSIGAVLIVDLARHYGGTDVRVMDVAQALHGRYPYAVATLSGSPLHERLQAAGLHALPLPFIRSDPRILVALGRAIRQGGFQVVDAHNVQSQGWGLLAATLARVPRRIATVHTAYGLTPGGFKGWRHEQVLRLNKRWGCHFVTVSQSIQRYLLGLGVAPERVTLSYNGVHFEELARPAAPSPLRPTLGWGSDKYVVVTVGRLERQKGYDFLLEAMSRAAQERPQLRCLFVGEGSERPALEAQSRRLGLESYVHFAGFRQDVTAILPTADAFCLSSRAEGLPYALLEAAAHRLPLLLSRVDGMAELLTHQQTAYFVEVGDVAALAKGLVWLVDHPAEAADLGQAAHDSLRQRLDPARMVAETLAVYWQKAGAS